MNTATTQAAADLAVESRGGRPMGTGGRRLQEAFEAVSGLPIFAEARRRLMAACASDSATTAEIAEMVESDAALAIVVLRAANNGGGHAARIGSVVDAIDALEPAGVRATVAPLDTYDLLDQPGAWAQHHDRFRRHGLAVRHAAERIAALVRPPNQDHVALAALVHDIGRFVLAHLHGDEHGPELATYSPDERVRRERVQLGIDHAIVGGVLLRRWALPDEIASAVERHHSPDAEGTGAIVRLADLLVHHCSGNRVSGEVIRSSASALGISDDQLRGLVFEYPYVGAGRRPASEPCPLSPREIDALRGLAEGKVYKQIAQELDLSVSTVRTHLHNVYRKIGAVDRAQAVLLARDRGWI
jgi:putative nucleotidyltransferase with HDIG domain